MAATYLLLRCRERVVHQHNDRHGADPFGDGSDFSGDFFDGVEIDIAAEFAVRKAVDADIDDHGAGTDHLGRDKSRLPYGRDENIRLASEIR